MKRIGPLNIGEAFQQMTRVSAPETPALCALGPCEDEATVLALPEPETVGGAPLWDAMASRRSVREYTPDPLTLIELSQLLWACQGTTARKGPHLFKTAPSAGARYPCETYVVLHRCEGIDAGVYRYLNDSHALARRRRGDVSQSIADAAMRQDMAAQAPAVFAWTAVFDRTTSRYRQRGYRYVYLDAAHIAAHLALAAVGMGLASCQIAALYDDAVNTVLGCDGVRESILYMSVVGRPAS